MKPADEIENVVKKMSFKAGPEMDKNLWAETSKARNEFHKKILAPSQHNIGRTIMKSPITKLAAAAVIIIACIIGLSLWRNTGSGIALADVLTRVEQARAVKYKSTFKVFDSEDPNKFLQDTRYTILKAQEYGSKVIIEKRDPNGEEITAAITYDYPHRKLREIQIGYTRKTYKHRVIDIQAQDEQSQSQEDSLSSLKEVLNSNHENIGRSIVDGVEVEGFQTTKADYIIKNYKYKGFRLVNGEDKQYTTKLWVDVKTLLPVRVEYLVSAIRRKGDTRIFLQQVDYNFQWDIPVDASTFEAPPIPDGYAIEDIFPEPAKKKNAIEGFKQCVELFGNYPERIDLAYLWAESEKSETAAALRLKEELNGLTGLQRDNKKMDALKPIRFLNKFYIGLTKKDSAYYGKTVTPKNMDMVLLRWKVSDNEYRVIYGDLHAETVTPEKLAELEKALPK
jgi:hypothetical protein